MKHNIGQQIGSWKIINWLPTKGNYELKCNCGNQGKGSATYVDSKIYLNVQRLGESRTQKSGETGETQ